MTALISVAEARNRLLARLSLVGVEDISVAQARGRVLARDVHARLTQPPFDAAQMDGWAVRARDCQTAPTVLTRVGTVAAGYRFVGTVEAGQAVRIFTGAPVPTGADAIVIQEDAEDLGETVRLAVPATPGKWIRPAGLDFAAGSIGLSAGRRLTARDIGFAAAMDHPWLTVRRRPRVAILPTGDEVVRPGEPRDGNQIVSANALALAALVEEAGGEAIQLGIARDSPDAIANAARQAGGCDLLVTSGGASVGAHDFVQAGLAAEGLELDFWRVALRPGKPLMVGRIGAMQVLGLPGNPVSTMVCGMIFMQPALRRLQGLDPALPIDYLPLARALPANDGREDYLRARLVDGAVDPFPQQDSSMIRVMAAADVLAIRPVRAPAAAAGELIATLRLDRAS